MSRAIALEEAAAFVWREADLLDRRAYEEWLELWAPEGLYIVPTDTEAKDHANSLNYIYDDADMRRMRVARLQSPHSAAASSAATTVRTVSRFVATSGGGETLSVRASQLLAEYSGGHHALRPANLELEFRRDGDRLLYTRKIVKLLGGEDGLTGIAYLL